MCAKSAVFLEQLETFLCKIRFNPLTLNILLIIFSPQKKNDSGTPYVFFWGEKLSFPNLHKTLDSDRGP